MSLSAFRLGPYQIKSVVPSPLAHAQGCLAIGMHSEANIFEMDWIIDIEFGDRHPLLEHLAPGTRALLLRIEDADQFELISVSGRPLMVRLSGGSRIYALRIGNSRWWLARRRSEIHGNPALHGICLEGPVTTGKLFPREEGDL